MNRRNSWKIVIRNTALVWALAVVSAHFFIVAYHLLRPRAVHHALYRALYAHLEPVWRSARIEFITDALDELPRHPYVDAMHYSAAANRSIAAAIALRLPGTTRRTDAASRTP